METKITHSPFAGAVRSYPTYEEWKLWLIFSKQSSKQSSYPTYEEWKQSQFHTQPNQMNRVLILPMRNGNPFIVLEAYIPPLGFLSYL